MSKVNELGGGTFACFDDIGVCALGCICPCIVWGQAMEDSGEGSCVMHCCLLYCIPCWLPFATASNEVTIDKKLGGPGNDWCNVCVCHCCCPHCAICNVARAVNKGKAQGLLKGGAPAVDEMKA